MEHCFDCGDLSSEHCSECSDPVCDQCLSYTEQGLCPECWFVWQKVNLWNPKSSFFDKVLKIFKRQSQR
jgi:hypothetical protein